MFNLSLITALQRLIAGFIAYSIVAGIVGGFQAWICKKMGDDGPEDLGYLTVNPMAHVDIFGTICLLLLGVGFGKPVPINPFHMPYKHRTLRYATALFSSLFMAIIITIISILVMSAFPETTAELTQSNFSFLSFQAKSFMDGLSLVIFYFFATGMLFALLSLVYGSFALLSYLIHDKISDEDRTITSLVFLILPIAILLLYDKHLYVFVLSIVLKIVNFFQGLL